MEARAAAVTPADGAGGKVRWGWLPGQTGGQALPNAKCPRSERRTETSQELALDTPRQDLYTRGIQNLIATASSFMSSTATSSSLLFIPNISET